MVDDDGDYLAKCKSTLLALVEEEEMAVECELLYKLLDQTPSILHSIVVVLSDMQLGDIGIRTDGSTYKSTGTCGGGGADMKSLTGVVAVLLRDPKKHKNLIVDVKEYSTLPPATATILSKKIEALFFDKAACMVVQNMLDQNIGVDFRSLGENSSLFKLLQLVNTQILFIQRGWEAYWLQLLFIVVSFKKSMNRQWQVLVLQLLMINMNQVPEVPRNGRNIAKLTKCYNVYLTSFLTYLSWLPPTVVDTSHLPDDVTAMLMLHRGEPLYSENVVEVMRFNIPIICVSHLSPTVVCNLDISKYSSRLTQEAVSALTGKNTPVDSWVTLARSLTIPDKVIAPHCTKLPPGIKLNITIDANTFDINTYKDIVELLATGGKYKSTTPNPMVDMEDALDVSNAEGISELVYRCGYIAYLVSIYFTNDPQGICMSLDMTIGRLYKFLIAVESTLLLLLAVCKWRDRLAIPVSTTPLRSPPKSFAEFLITMHDPQFICMFCTTVNIAYDAMISGVRKQDEHSMGMLDVLGNSSVTAAFKRLPELVLILLGQLPRESSPYSRAKINLELLQAARKYRCIRNLNAFDSYSNKVAKPFRSYNYMDISVDDVHCVGGGTLDRRPLLSGNSMLAELLDASEYGQRFTCCFEDTMSILNSPSTISEYDRSVIKSKVIYDEMKCAIIENEDPANMIEEDYKLKHNQVFSRKYHTLQLKYYHDRYADQCIDDPTNKSFKPRFVEIMIAEYSEMSAEDSSMETESHMDTVTSSFSGNIDKEGIRREVSAVDYQDSKSDSVIELGGTENGVVSINDTPTKSSKRIVRGAVPVSKRIKSAVEIELDMSTDSKSVGSPNTQTTGGPKSLKGESPKPIRNRAHIRSLYSLNSDVSKCEQWLLGFERLRRYRMDIEVVDLSI